MKYTKIIVNSELRIIRDNERNCFIPIDLGNIDYTEYLEWLQVPNTPDEEIIEE